MTTTPDEEFVSRLEVDKAIKDLLEVINSYRKQADKLREYGTVRYNTQSVMLGLPLKDGVYTPGAPRVNFLGSMIHPDDPCLEVSSTYPNVTRSRQQTYRLYESEGGVTPLEAGYCAKCGEAFWAFKSVRCLLDGRLHRWKTCTCHNCEKAQARAKYEKSHVPVEVKPRPCSHCGTEFTPKRSDARFCKAACRVASHRKQ